VAEKYVRGMQFGGDVDPAAYAATGAPHVMLASLKHFNAYSLETNRMGSQGNVSLFDLWETYLPQYERPLVAAGAAGTMCSYFSMRITPNGSAAAPVYVPSCADAYLLTDVVRTYWNRSDATHLTDCGAVWNMQFNNHFVANLTLAAAASINAGCDMNSNTITPTQLSLAVQLGLVAEATVRATAARVLAQRFRTGHFDPLESPSAQPLLALGAADVGTAASRAAAADGVAQGLVLVKNARGALPIARGKRVALLGPQGASFDALLGDCYCTGYCAEGSACFPSLQQALAAANAGGVTVALPGVTMHGNDSSWGAALAAAAAADVVVLALGTDRSVAGEGNDRGDGIGLPGLQASFGVAVLAAAAAAKVPVVLLLLHNLPVSFDELVGADAIVDAWAPLAYADTVAAALFGDVNRFGKATMTVYPKAYADAVSLFDFSMSKPPGRSYKYYDGSVGAPLIAFGTGGSYSTFAVACALAPPAAPPALALAIACNVSNVAGPAGDEVLMVYHRPSAAIVARVGGAHPLPLRALVGFDRVSVAAGATAPLALSLPVDEACAFVNEDGATVLYAGTHFLDVSNGNGANITLTVELPADRVVKSPPRPRHLLTPSQA
jgi:beta-glucosidase-like glycosyl hydrolase